MNSLVLSLLGLGVAVALTIAALEKVLDLAYWHASLRRYRLRGLDSAPIAYGVPIVEFLVACLLVGGAQPAAGLASAALFAAFALLLWVAYRRGARHDCGCWGRRTASRIGPATTVRTFGLGLASLLTAAGGGGLPWYMGLTIVVVCALGWLIGQELAHVGTINPVVGTGRS